jgi:hypothetical protein
VGQVFNLRADFPIGAVRGLQIHAQDAILAHTPVAAPNHER